LRHEDDRGRRGRCRARAGGTGGACARGARLRRARAAHAAHERQAHRPAGRARAQPAGAPRAVRGPAARRRRALSRAIGRRRLCGAPGRGAPARVPSVRRERRARSRRAAVDARGQGRGRPPARVPARPPRARPARLSRGGEAVGHGAVAALLSGAHRRRGRRRRLGVAGGARRVTKSLARLALLALVMLPPVRRAFGAAGLSWLYLMALAFAASLAAVPLVRALATWWSVLDVPAARKVHAVPTPLLGGAAVYAAFAATVLFNFSFSRQLKGVAVGATIVVVVGVLDDIFDLSPRLKLLGQLAAGVVALAYGVTLNVVPHQLAGA